MYRFAVLCALLLFPSVSNSDVAPDANTLSHGRVQYTMCNAQPNGSEGVCTKGGDEIVADVRTRSVLTFDATMSTSSTYTCDIYTNSVGFDASTSAQRQQANTTSLTATTQVITLSGVLNRVWVNCSVINADGAVTVLLTVWEPK